MLDSVRHSLTTNVEGANQHLMHPGLSLQLSQEVYYSTDSYWLYILCPSEIYTVPMSSVPRVCTLVLFITCIAQLSEKYIHGNMEFSKS